jgi:hypothetical protein
LPSKPPVCVASLRFAPEVSVTDWRKLIGKKESVVLPYLGGERIRAKDREVRLAEPPAKLGWYRFEIEGRNAKAVEPAEPDFHGLTKVRGHVAFETLFPAGAPPQRIALMPDDEPPLFASCICFRWHTGDIVFGELDFEKDSEGELRQLFAERKPVEWPVGVPATLRAAFAWATVHRLSEEKDIPCSPREAWPHTSDIAMGGPEAASALLEKLEELRHGRRIIVAGRSVRLRAMVEHATRALATYGNAVERARDSLEAAGARPLSLRRLAAGQQLEVHFDFQGERFITIADAITLQVIDAGICLIGSDGELTLDSLPSAIREAMDSGVLVITRR